MRARALLFLPVILLACGDSTSDCPVGTLGCPCTSSCGEGVCDNGTCREALTCAACAPHQQCTEEGDLKDAECSDACDVGYFWDAGTTSCTLLTCTPNVLGSIAQACIDEARACLDDPQGAMCTDCVDGFLEEGIVCRPVLTCDDCAADLRDCASPEGAHADALCGDCSTGYVDDGGSCRAVHTCDTLPTACSGSEMCVEATDDADAYCFTASCPPCDGVGEDGVWPTLTTSRQCICRTLDGYFYSVAGDGTFPCDADADGWVRDSARFAIEATPGSPHQVNARCHLRTVNGFRLVNEAGEELDLPVDPPVELYETVRNDDQTQLSMSTRVPAYNEQNGRALRAEEVNSLTKACVTANADHNDNGLSDVSEWGRPQVVAAGQQTLPGSIPADMRARVEIFTRYSYFVELHRGWFEDQGGWVGRYVIAEKDRTPGSGDAVPLVYGAVPGSNPEVYESEYWQDCPRARDRWYIDRDGDGQTDATLQPPRTLDFASVSGPSRVWGGLQHSSQFKCIQLLDGTTYGNMSTAEKLENPQQQTLATVTALNWQLDVCEATTGSNPALGGVDNPRDAALTCSAVVDPSPLDVVWAAVRIDSSPDYQRGCVLRCDGHAFICPGLEVGNPVPRTCWSLCGDFAGSEPAVGLTNGTWTVDGEVTAQPFGTDSDQDVLNDLSGGGWTVKLQP